MQENIPGDALPPEEKTNDVFLSERVENTIRDAGNISEELLFSGSSAGDGDVAIKTGEEMSYGSLRERVNRLGNFLLEKGVEEGDRVLVHFPNAPDFVVSNFAVQRINAVVVPVSPMHTQEDLEHIVEDSGAGFVLTGNEEAFSDIDIETLSSPLQKDNFSPELEARGSGEDFALLLYSSGTTGKPKGSIKNHRELLADGEIMCNCLNLEEDDVISGTVPMNFAMGYLIFILVPYRRGASVSLLPRPDFEEFAGRIADDGVTITFTVPAGYNKLMDAVEGTETDLSSIRYSATGGQEMKRHTYDRWKDMAGLDLINYYGAGEYLTPSLYQSGDLVPCHHGGAPEDMKVKLFEDGELGVRPPVKVRYWNRPELQEESIKEGYFMTGDIFEREEGRFRFVSRKDDMIVTSGYKVSANEVENALLRHPGVEDTAVVGVPHDTRGNVVKAFVVPKDGLEGDRGVGELQGYVKSEISPYKYPREVEFVDSIPRTEAGKIDRKKLEEF